MAVSQYKASSSPREVIILLVDDDVGYRLVLRHEIKKLGGNITVHEAGCGGEALNLLKEKTVDIIVLDYAMPDMKGTDVLSRLKELGITKKAIGLTMHEEFLSDMVSSCAMEAFSKEHTPQFCTFLKDKINDLYMDC